MKDSTLECHIKNNCIANSYLLIDRDIVKLKEIAKWFSTHYNTADVFWLVRNASEGTGNPSIRVRETEEFITKSALAPVGKSKLLIICDASTMTIAAQNKILKTIEDTVNDTFLLLASNAEAVLPTIKSRCVIIYPTPSPALTVPPEILDKVSKVLFECKSLDDALPYIPELTKKDNFQNTLLAFSNLVSSTLDCFVGQSPSRKDAARQLTIQKRNAIMSVSEIQRRVVILKRLSIINRNIAANCNAQNIFDTLLIELFQ